jgi:hypothetical protein
VSKYRSCPSRHQHPTRGGACSSWMLQSCKVCLFDFLVLAAKYSAKCETSPSGVGILHELWIPAATEAANYQTPISMFKLWLSAATKVNVLSSDGSSPNAKIYKETSIDQRCDPLAQCFHNEPLADVQLGALLQDPSSWPPRIEAAEADRLPKRLASAIYMKRKVFPHKVRVMESS